VAAAEDIETDSNAARYVLRVWTVNQSGMYYLYDQWISQVCVTFMNSGNQAGMCYLCELLISQVSVTCMDSESSRYVLPV